MWSALQNSSSRRHGHRLEDERGVCSWLARRPQSRRPRRHRLQQADRIRAHGRQAVFFGLAQAGNAWANQRQCVARLAARCSSSICRPPNRATELGYSGRLHAKLKFAGPTHYPLDRHAPPLILHPPPRGPGVAPIRPVIEPLRPLGDRHPEVRVIEVPRTVEPRRD